MYTFTLRYSDPKDRTFDRLISDICFALRETSFTISDFIETGSLVESGVVKVGFS